MTAIAAPVRGASSSRITTTARIHTTNPWTIIYTPWLILFAIFALNYAIWQAVTIAADGKPLPDDAFTNNGGVTYLFIYMIVVAVQAMNQTFSFVVGLGATRRDYFLGTSVVFVALSLMFGVGVAVLAGVERLTGGWGLGGAFFTPGFMQDVPLIQVATVYTLLLLVMFFLGTAVAAIFMRWGANGLVTFFLALAALVVAAVFLITTNDAWPAVGRFFTDNSVLALSAYTIPVTVVCALTGWTLMRRATPKG